jgi:uncharacterized protein YfaS (alpha-2-macroglobulin family)
MKSMGIFLGMALGLTAAAVLAADAAKLDPITIKPPPTQVEPEVLQMLRDEGDMAVMTSRAISGKTATLAEKLGFPDPHPHAAVAGTVRDARGKPLPGAAVVLRDTIGNLMAEMVTDAEGHYQVESLQNGPYVVEVLPTFRQATKWSRTWFPADRSFLRADVLNVTGAGAIADVTVLPGANVHLKLVAQGKPLAGAMVKVCGESYHDCQAAKANTKGRVIFLGLPVSPLRIAVAATSGSTYEFTTAISSAGAKNIKLDMSKGKLIAMGHGHD